ncbi:hypothetical protein EON80_04780 [bacterium]|nr:MAG: hypothetical protein EON80_04780 [bacterium]
MKIRFFASCALVLVTVLSCRAQLLSQRDPGQDEPKTDAVFTSSREIRALDYDRGILWAATAGGVLRFGESWSKWNRYSGLPANEAFEIGVTQGEVKARLPLHSAVFDLGQTSWATYSEPAFKKPALSVQWLGKKVVACLDGLTIEGQNITTPPSPGTHISALFVFQNKLVVSFYGDGIWFYDGAKWTPDKFNDKLSTEAREITALESDGWSLIIGTRRAGVWSVQNGTWKPLGSASGDEIYNANIQFATVFQGAFWGSTLDDGLVIKGPDRWGHVTVPTLSATAPRQLLEWNKQLFVRHGGGIVDSFDGSNWTKNALKTIPRKGVYALAGDDNTLYAAGWGGWSEWDGRNWTPHFEVPELKGVPLMGLLADGDALWIATQSRGLGRYIHGTKEFRWFDERDGLPDDWVTTLIKFDGKIYAGTFVGGLARLDDDKWFTFDELTGQNVTALAIDNGRLMAATRTGLWTVEGNSAVKVKETWLDNEVQALAAGENGLWVGARTSLNFLRHAEPVKLPE